jgi:hypothetical protein
MFKHDLRVCGVTSGETVHIWVYFAIRVTFLVCVSSTLKNRQLTRSFVFRTQLSALFAEAIASCKSEEWAQHAQHQHQLCAAGAVKVEPDSAAVAELFGPAEMQLEHSSSNGSPFAARSIS